MRQSQEFNPSVRHSNDIDDQFSAGSQLQRDSALPIAEFKHEILKAIEDNSVVVITAETGAGKSTQVPKYLLEAGYNLVITQPRRIAARTVAERVANELNEPLGKDMVGYRTAVDRKDSPDTRALFCTDGLALVRELVGQNKGVLVLDEVHEWNENMEVLVAWVKKQIQEGSDLKVVLMSATLEAEKLSQYFGGAPVISVPGRQYKVVERDTSGSLVQDVQQLVAEGRNVLVFQPGKAEIAETVAQLGRLGVDAEIIPLHGGLTSAEQARCFKHYDRPKVVVATNVAQTSITIDDIDAVVDSGMERRVELSNGIEGLYLRPISRADSAQRKGRAGRTKEGIYIDCCRATERSDFPVAEILRKRLDQTVLRLAIAGFHMEELEFFHQPKREEILDARKTLIALGCMKEGGKVTPIGRLVNRLPVSVEYARMLVEADRLDVTEDLLTVAAILEQGGITVPPPSRNNPDRPDWRKLVPTEEESDVIGQLKVWDLAEKMTKQEMKECGISLRNFFRAKEVRKQLESVLKHSFRIGSSGSREDILKAVCAGMVDRLFKESYGSYSHPDHGDRELGANSLVTGAEWLVGTPFDLEINTRRGRMVLHLIEHASRVNPAWLTEIAPHMVTVETGLDPRYEVETDRIVSTTKTMFGSQEVAQDIIESSAHPEADRVFVGWLARVQMSSASKVSQPDIADVLEKNKARQALAKKLNERTGENSFKVYTHDEIAAWFDTALKGATSLASIRQPANLLLPTLPDDRVERVLEMYPDSVSIMGHQYPLSYSGGTAMTTIDADSAENWYHQLPDDGVRLPSGQLVQITIRVDYYTRFKSTDVKELKSKYLQYVSDKQFSEWQAMPVDVPDFLDDFSNFPALYTEDFAVSTLTGEPLKVYGALKYSPHDQAFSWTWSQLKSETEAIHAETMTLARSMYEERAQQRMEVQKKLELEQDIANGLALRDFVAWHRRGGMANNGDGWVVQSDGSLRPPDSSNAGRKSDGDYCWNFVQKDELAIRWTCDHVGDVQGNSLFEVVKLPIDGLTEAQLEKVGEIEEAIGCSPGSFGLNEKLNKQREEFIESLQEEFPCCPVSGSVIAWELDDYNRVTGTNGLLLDCCSDRQIAMAQRTPLGETECDGRVATIVAKNLIIAADGVIETLIYYKYGIDNVAVRFRPLYDGELEEFKDSDEPASDGLPKGGVDLSKLFGGNSKLLD